MNKKVTKDVEAIEDIAARFLMMFVHIFITGSAALQCDLSTNVRWGIGGLRN